MAAQLPLRPTLSASPPSLSTLRTALRSATRDCLDRNLPQAAKFAGQLLAALPAPTPRAQSPAPAPPRDDRPGPSRSTPHPDHHDLASPHVHFRTSTPVKTADGTPVHPASGAPGGGGGGIGAGAPRPSLSGLLPLGSFRSARGGSARDSLGSVLSMGPASSPVIERSNAFDRLDDDLDEHMHPVAGPSSRAPPPGGAPGAAESWSDAGYAARQEWIARDDDEQDLYALALACLRSHELQRTAHVLRDCTGPKARWLRSYAKYLVRPPFLAFGSLQGRAS